MGITASSEHRDARKGGGDGQSGGGNAGGTSHMPPSGHPVAYGSGDVIRRCNCYSMSLDRKCYRHSLTFSAQPNSGISSEKSGPRPKKKRNYGFATFKKKLIGKRRHSKGSDHGRCFGEHFLDCSSVTLKALLSQYESLTLLKDLSVQANLARAPAQTLGQSLADLLNSGSCSDLVLSYGGHRFSAHRHILMARCPYFSRHLSFLPDAKEFQLRTRNCVVSPAIIKRILIYLYTGNPEILVDLTEARMNLAALEEEFAIPNSLETDLAFLGESGSLSDCKLIFSGVDESGNNSDLELNCHRPVLAARSGFFRRLLERRKKAGNESTEIRLDGEIIPAKYGRVILHTMYMDSLDMRLVSAINDSVYGSSVEEGASVYGRLPAARNLPSGSENSPESFLKEEEMISDIKNLFEIGRFLEFNFLSQCCEDSLMQLMGTHNVVDILSWSLQPHGSAWISRQAYQFLEEEFYSMASNTDILGLIDQETILKILKSDFTQASESEILQALIRWGEQQIKLKNKDYGSTSSTLSRKSAKRRDVCDSELKELLASLLPHVRIQHILPRDRTSDVMDMAITRNLFPCYPDFACQSSQSTKFAPWDPRNSPKSYVRPRLFLPYFEECKNIIQERCAQDPEIISSSSPRMGVTDGLYMLGNNEDVALESASSIPCDPSKLPDNEMISKMIGRLEKLLNYMPVQRAFSLTSIDDGEILRLVELRVVREYNFPDTYTSFLHKMRGKYLASNVGALDRSKISSASIGGFQIKNTTEEEHVRQRRSQTFSNNGQVPDVTLATSAFCSLSFNTDFSEESPDLVSMEGKTSLIDGLVPAENFSDSPEPPREKGSGCSLSSSWKRNVYSVVGNTFRSNF